VLSNGITGHKLWQPAGICANAIPVYNSSSITKRQFKGIVDEKMTDSSSTSRISKQAQLDKVKAEILEANVCPELAQTATNLVFGEGDPDAEVVFVGEAPGKQEDLQGRPFVGAAGKFLDEMLLEANLKRSEVYITNIVKYRPANNRDPLPQEKKVFLSYLQTQLEIIQPKLVVTLGRHSMNCFLPDLQISKVHGEPKRIKVAMKQVGGVMQFVILPLFHPAAALYNGSMRSTLMEDFQAIPRVLKIINQGTVDK
jgi:DNA polymerase